MDTLTSLIVVMFSQMFVQTHWRAHIKPVPLSISITSQESGFLNVWGNRQSHYWKKKKRKEGRVERGREAGREGGRWAEGFHFVQVTKLLRNSDCPLSECVQGILTESWQALSGRSLVFRDRDTPCMAIPHLEMYSKDTKHKKLSSCQNEHISTTCKKICEGLSQNSKY